MARKQICLTFSKTSLERLGEMGAALCIKRSRLLDMAVEELYRHWKASGPTMVVDAHGEPANDTEANVEPAEGSLIG